MSHEALPIDRARFAEALESLPLDALHSKVAELRNSMDHLRSSNEQMVPFADEGDQDCKDAMFENLVVINRMNERIGLLRAEVERRGMRWSEAEIEEHDQAEELVNGDSPAPRQPTATSTAPQTQPSHNQSGSLTDDQLRAQLEARMAQGLDDDQEEGVHL